MTKRVLIFQTDPVSAKILSRYFLKRGDRVWKTSRLQEAAAVLSKEQPDLAFVDLHAPDNTSLELLDLINQKYPETQVIVTNRKPDIRQELLARELGAGVFLREPFTQTWINNALLKLENGPEFEPEEKTSPSLPRVRIPMRIKITAPYILLAITFVIVSLFLAGRFIFESLQERYTNQLIDAGKLAADWMVEEERQMLETLRLISHTEGLGDAVNAGDANRLREITLPVLINYKEDALEILDPQGKSILSLNHTPGGDLEDYQSDFGDTSLSNQDFVQKVLSGKTDNAGDKYAGLANGAWGDIFYISGPIKDANNNLVGVLLVGKSITNLTKDLREATLAQLTIYNSNGTALASTLFPDVNTSQLNRELAHSIMESQDSQSVQRDLKVASGNYAEILGPWEARGGADLGVIGVALPQNFFVRPSRFTSIQAIVFFFLIFLAIVLIGILTARQITQPLKQVVEASQKIAEGDFQVKIQPSGNDEIMVLAHAFNYMVTGLQEGSIYRDLLGRTVSPEVRDALRRSFTLGELKLEGQNTIGTVLVSDIRNFTTLAEKEEPTTILKWLNAYFGRLVPIVNSYGGIVDKFEGDALLAFFGILPNRLAPEESAYHACQAAIEMMSVIDEINTQRSLHNEPQLITGIGINTGMLMAGGLGTADRLDYTIIGDTVNTAQRMQDLTRQFGETAAVVGENCLTALRGRRGEFLFEPMGEHALKGKSELLWVYRLRPGISKRGKRNGQPLYEPDFSLAENAEYIA